MALDVNRPDLIVGVIGTGAMGRGMRPGDRITTPREIHGIRRQSP